MIKYLFAVKNNVTNSFMDPVAFDDRKQATATMRRQVRNAFINDQMTLDEIGELDFVCVGTFQNLNGDVKPTLEDEQYGTPLYDFVVDLVGDDDV